jgi:hypothetical protein
VFTAQSLEIAYPEPCSALQYKEIAHPVQSEVMFEVMDLEPVKLILGKEYLVTGSFLELDVCRCWMVDTLEKCFEVFQLDSFVIQGVG